MFHGVLEVHIADGINMGRFILNINLTIIVNQFHRRKSWRTESERHRSKGKDVYCLSK